MDKTTTEQLLRDVHRLDIVDERGHPIPDGPRMLQAYAEAGGGPLTVEQLVHATRFTPGRIEPAQLALDKAGWLLGGRLNLEKLRPETAAAHKGGLRAGETHWDLLRRNSRGIVDRNENRIKDGGLVLQVHCHAADAGRGAPTVQEIIEATRFSADRIQEANSALAEAGFLTVEPPGVLRVNLAKLRAEARPDDSAARELAASMVSRRSAATEAAEALATLQPTVADLVAVLSDEQRVELVRIVRTRQAAAKSAA